MTIDDILQAGAIATGTTVSALRARCRRPQMVARRRFVAMKMRAAGFSYPAIGRALKRHHTTIMHLLFAV